jgi:hypothetical protein
LSNAVRDRARGAVARAQRPIRGPAPFVGARDARKPQRLRPARDVCSTRLEDNALRAIRANDAMKTPQDHPSPDMQRGTPRQAAAPPKEKHGGIPWTPLPTEPQVRRRATDALPWRPTERMRWER